MNIGLTAIYKEIDCAREDIEKIKTRSRFGCLIKGLWGFPFNYEYETDKYVNIYNQLCLYTIQYHALADLKNIVYADSINFDFRQANGQHSNNEHNKMIDFWEKLKLNENFQKKLSYLQINSDSTESIYEFHSSIRNEPMHSYIEIQAPIEITN